MIKRKEAANTKAEKTAKKKTVARNDKSHCLEAPEFCFKMTLEAAEKNFLVLKRHGFDLSKAIEDQLNTPVGYGSEFRKPRLLSPLL